MFKLPPILISTLLSALFILVICISRWIIMVITFSGAFLPFVCLLLWSVVANSLPTLKHWVCLTVEFFIYLYLAQFIIYSGHMHCRYFLQIFLTMFQRPVVEMALSDLTTIIPHRGTQRSNCQHPLDHTKSKRVPEKHLLVLYWLRQSLWLCGSQQTGKVFKRWEYQTTLPASWEICMQVKKQHLELDREQPTGFKLGKE